MSAAVPVGIRGIERYEPAGVQTAAQIADAAGLDEQLLIEKFGLTSKHVAAPDEHVSDMCVGAGRRLLELQELDAASLDAVVYFGSYWKDYEVWSASPHIQHRLGAVNAFALELINVSAGAPVALKVVRDMMRSDDRLRRVLLVGAAREGSLIDYGNSRSRFMFNFGAGGVAVLLERGLDRNEVLESSILTDGRFSLDVRVPAGGSVHPASHETVDSKMHFLDVADPPHMKELLDPITVPNFLQVATDAIERSGHSVSDLGFLATIHVKRSLHETLLAKLGLTSERSWYLHDWGHMSAIDPFIALSLAQDDGHLSDGDLVCILAAGTGYTWAATCLRWGSRASG
ncbi:MAG TPA: 3-oxoacyl-ACP synthase [Actinomycetota bacterium]|nr:3-oxoacyl-ACP synthase [Actinomycetota bacterium]